MGIVPQESDVSKIYIIFSPAQARPSTHFA